MKKNTLIIGFDFSIDKPACCVMGKDNFHKFLIWPLKLTKVEKDVYENNIDDIQCYCRDKKAISKSGEVSSSAMTLEHTTRSINLANLIIQSLDKVIEEYGEYDDLYVVTEGLSFNSKGNSTLDLATYKGVLLAKLYEHYSLNGMYTYGPLSIKSIAGCATKDKKSDKHAMINAFMDTDIESVFKDKLIAKEMFNSKGKEYLHCVDDLVDSYWACITLMKKENIEL